MNKFHLCTMCGEETYSEMKSRLDKRIKNLNDEDVDELCEEILEVPEEASDLISEFVERVFGDRLREEIDDCFFESQWENRVRNEEHIVEMDVDEIHRKLREDNFQSFASPLISAASKTSPEIAALFAKSEIVVPKPNAPTTDTQH